MYKQTKTFLNSFKNELLLSALFIFPLLPINYIGFVGVFLSTVLILINKIDKKAMRKNLLLSIGYVFFLYVSLVYSENILEGWNQALKMILLFLFPIVIILFLPFKREYLNYIMITFIFVNVLLCLYIYNVAIDTLAHKKMMFLKDSTFLIRLKTFISTPYHVPFNWSSRDFKVFVFLHKAYVSLSLLLAYTLGFYYLCFKCLKNSYKLLLVFSLLFIGFFIFYMKSLPNLFLLLIVNLVLFFTSKYVTKVIVVIFMIVIISVTFFFQESIIELLKKTFELINNDFRRHLWSCAIEVGKGNVLFGSGIGDMEADLLKCYSESNIVDFSYAIRHKLNSHNQYAAFFVSGGLVVVLLFLCLLGNNLYLAISRKDVLFFCIILILGFNFTFENVIYRIYGIYLFSIFNSFFLLRNSNLEVIND